MPYDGAAVLADARPAADERHHLAYLDVWEREVTYLEDPNLVEVAVGVDTTARAQTAWQVRLLPNIGTATCASDDDDIPRLARRDRALRRPADDGHRRGRAPRTTRARCRRPAATAGSRTRPTASRSTTGGAPGTATFKWSRDNGSVAIPVVEMVSTTVLRLATVGKDDVLRVSTGDWVEILDDHYELGQKPGELRKVTVDDAARTITFTGAIPADLRPANAADAAARHLRVRRWDQAGVVKERRRRELDRPRRRRLDRRDHRADERGDAGRARARRRRLVLGRRRRQRQVPRRRLLDLRRAHGRHVDREARPRRRRSASTTTTRGSASSRSRLGRRTAAASGRRSAADGGGCDCTVCLTPESHASARLQDAVDQIKAAGGDDLPRGRRLRPRRRA